MRRALSKARRLPQRVPDDKRLQTAPDYPTLVGVADNLRRKFLGAADRWESLSPAAALSRSERKDMAQAGTDHMLAIFLILHPPQRRGVCLAITLVD